MPIYDYECVRHGYFDRMRPMSESAAPHECPECGAASPRVFVCTPGLLDMDPLRRAAHATNERSAHEPRSSKQHRHGPGCGCSKPRAKGGSARDAGGTRAFPDRRPWMISH